MKRIVLSLKVATILVCLYGALLGHYPPANAQTPPAKPTDTIAMPQQFAISPYDPEFRADINAINARLDDNDKRREAIKEISDTNKGDIREINGDLHWSFWIIGALLSGSIALPQLKGFGKKLAE
jgi:hypothetical protein